MQSVTPIEQAAEIISRIAMHGGEETVFFVDPKTGARSSRAITQEVASDIVEDWTLDLIEEGLREQAEGRSGWLSFDQVCSSCARIGTPWRSLGSVDSALWALARAAGNHPTLSPYGFGVYKPGDDLKRMRREMLTRKTCAQFLRARLYLRHCLDSWGRLPCRGSYGLKHLAEQWWGSRRTGKPYVSNGAMIAAALDLGLAISKPDGPNVVIRLPRRRLH